jgi:hypothetical protein
MGTCNIFFPFLRIHTNINRRKTPWVFASWHRPWYCSNTKHENSAESMRASYEDLFHKYGVRFLIIFRNSLYYYYLRMLSHVS